MKKLICLLSLLLILPTAAFAEYIGTYCIDIDLGNGYYNAYEIAVNTQGEYFLINGKYRQSGMGFWKGNTYGGAYIDTMGNIAITIYDVIPIGTTLESYTTFIKLNPSTLEGNYTTMTNICNDTTNTFKNGSAILKGCN